MIYWRDSGVAIRRAFLNWFVLLQGEVCAQLVEFLTHVILSFLYSPSGSCVAPHPNMPGPRAGCVSFSTRRVVPIVGSVPVVFSFPDGSIPGFFSGGCEPFVW